MKLLLKFTLTLLLLAVSHVCFMQPVDTAVVYNYTKRPLDGHPELQSLIKSDKSRQFIAPLCLLSSGLLMLSNDLLDRHDVKTFVSKEFRGYHHNMDNYLQYSPIAAAYLIDLVGYRSKNTFIEKSIILAEAELMMLAVVTGLKQVTHVLRPDGSDYLSFPSGHTAQAFVAASFLAHEYGKKSPWIAVTGYTVATVTGCMRIMNNKHWFSDVLFGAGIGILCTNIAYMTHRYEWTKYRAKLALVPVVGDSSYGASMYFTF